jgi:hypothetical protein
MADVRFVPKSATKPATKWATRSAGALALVGALAGAGALLVWGCTDNSGNGKFVEPNRPFPTDGASAAVDGSTDGATDAHATTDAAADHGAAPTDGANSDLGADR